MAIRIDIDISDVDDELARLQRVTARDLLPLEAVLAAQQAATQAAVHIITGSLKASGRAQSQADRHSWTGTITYGGPSPGSVNDPVDYAIYELRRRGGHDFIAPAVAMDGDYAEAILTYLRGVT